MQIDLKYGNSSIPFNFDRDQFEVLGALSREGALSDIEIGEALEDPLGSPPIDELIRPGESILIILPDATRQCASGQVINLLIRRLIQNGTMPHDIRVIFATGIHRPPTEAEKQELLTPFIYQRIRHLEHNPRDLVTLAKFGETKRGIPIELNRALIEHDHIITIGGINWHYFVGFGGGRKMICPGLASSRTINETHKLAFDFEKMDRREGVGIGMLEGNAIHEEFIEIAEKAPPGFAINTIVNDKGDLSRIFCGNWKSSHEAGCRYFADKFSIEVKEKRGIVIVSAGGSPYDINLIQAHKALENAAQICEDGGEIIFIAECADGLGRSDFLKWFEAGDSDALAEKLAAGYQVNGQSAWALLKKAERFNIKIITDLPRNEISLMRMQKAQAIEILNDRKGYILPFGAKIRVGVNFKKNGN